MLDACLCLGQPQPQGDILARAQPAPHHKPPMPGRAASTTQRDALCPFPLGTSIRIGPFPYTYQANLFRNLARATFSSHQLVTRALLPCAKRSFQMQERVNDMQVLLPAQGAPLVPDPGRAISNSQQITTGPCQPYDLLELRGQKGHKNPQHG